MVLYIVAKTFHQIYWDSTQQSGSTHDVGFGSHTNIATIQTISGHRSHDVRTMGFNRGSIARILDRQHLFRRVVNDPQSIGIFVLGQWVLEPLDARGAVIVTERRVREVETYVHHTSDNTLAREGMRVGRVES